ncbi:hypothetical protein KLEP7_gp17 [Pseudaeromonas phage vB_PpeM_ KLEP7]|nr:hypothetical protein KLEP7_gp17 [Pseudaeromonas phage vB_PpeM_ KLEP7]
MATYNLFISGGFSDNAPRYNRLVYTSFPVIQLDVTETYSISLNNKVTNFPVESRSNISDHIFCENIKISFDATIGLAMPYYSAYSNLIKITDKQNVVKSNRPQQAYDLLKKVRDEKYVMDILTEQELFEGMVITNLQVSKNNIDDQLKFSIELEKIRVVEIGKTILATINSNNKGINDKTSGKKSDGSKPTGDTAKEDEKVLGYIGKDAAAREAQKTKDHPNWLKEKTKQPEITVD